MSLKFENSRRVAKSRLVCMALYTDEAHNAETVPSVRNDCHTACTVNFLPDPGSYVFLYIVNQSDD
jgi:hypothetical protein